MEAPKKEKMKTTTECIQPRTNLGGTKPTNGARMRARTSTNLSLSLSLLHPVRAS